MSSNASTPCESWEEQISLLAAGCLSPDEEKAVRQHIASCGPCQTEFEQVTGLCKHLKEIPSVELPWSDSVVKATITEITRSQKAVMHPLAASPHAEKRRHVRSELFAVVCIAAVLLATVGWTLTLTNPQRAEIARRPKTEPKQQNFSTLGAINVVAARNDASPPTLLELRNAFAQSDDQFDSLLAQQSGTTFPAPTNVRLLDESL